ncbi:hypothetical protein C4552_00430 [Candidatus Parcubacteria bacterium]|nr:MAG: hypothetical protein C4552_00430 [Candidatus Parcubacteria bacterium]
MTYIVKQNTFEGPLDVLLVLIQERKLSINEVSLGKVTDDFLEHLKTMQAGGQPDQEILAEFIVVASQLLLIKSRSLLPGFQVSAEEVQSIAELEERLALWQRIKEVSKELGALAAAGPQAFAREAYLGTPTVFYPPKSVTADTLAKAFAAVLELVPKVEKLVEEKIRKVISLEEKIKELKSLLQGKVERAFSELVSGAKEKVDVVVSFLAVLELAKQKLIAVDQDKPFGDIRIRGAHES